MTVAADGVVVDRVETHPWATASAVFSPDRAYRYVLTRTWGDAAPLAFVMLNPSVADAFRLDATVTRCVKRAFLGGYGGLLVLNVFALRSTDPKLLPLVTDPVGPQNDTLIAHHLRLAKPRTVVCAWGTGGGLNGRGERVRRQLAAEGWELQCLGVTKHGHPRHPLYVRADAPLQPYGSS